MLEFACDEVVPRLARTTDEIGHILKALDGGYVPAGPSGSPTRGLVNVLPTGRNFYSVDPKAIPSRLSWEVGQSLADSLVQRYLQDTGEYPKSVGLTVWGTSAMRTQATTSPRSWRCWAAVRCGTTPRAGSPASR